MSELKRYDIHLCHDSRCAEFDSESPSGDWVRYEDIPKWQPIETAPKPPGGPFDWFEAIVYDPKTGAVGHATRWGDNWYWVNDDEGSSFKPSHWMMLPEPPKEQK